MLRGGLSASAILLKYGRFGSSIDWDKNVPAISAYVGFKSKDISAELKIYEELIESIQVDAKKPYRALKWLEIVPTAKYSIDRDKNKFYQAKVIFRVGRK